MLLVAVHFEAIVGKDVAVAQGINRNQQETVRVVNVAVGGVWLAIKEGGVVGLVVVVVVGAQRVFQQ